MEIDFALRFADLSDQFNLFLEENKTLFLFSAHLSSTSAPDRLMLVALAPDEAPDVGQSWMDGWIAGRASGFACFVLAAPCIPSAQLPVGCLEGSQERCSGVLSFFFYTFIKG